MSDAVAVCSWRFEWAEVGDAVAYELLVRAEGSDLATAEVVTREPHCSVRFPHAVVPSVKVRPIVIGSGDSLSAATAAPNSWSRIAVQEPLDDRAEIELEDWLAYDGRRLGLARFNVTTDTVVRVLDGRLDLEWVPPRQAEFLEICLRGDRSAGCDIVRRWIRTAGNEPLDLSDVPPGNHHLIVRCGFPSRRRFGPRTNVVRVAMGTAAERRDWADQRRIAVERSERLARVGQASRSVADNAEVLLADLAARRTELRAVPLNASIALGYDCNADCLQCDEGRVRRPHRVPESLIDDVINVAIPGGLASCELVGGEPLLYAETERIAGVIESSGSQCEVQLRTNGMLLGETWARRVAAGRYSIIISLDGASKATFNRIRRKLDFERVVANMRRVSEQAADNPAWDGFGVYFVVMRQNAHEVVDIVRLAAEIDIRSVHLSLVENPQAQPELDALDPLIDRDCAAKLLDDLYASQRLAKRLGIAWVSRAVQRILCEYPSLVQTPEQTKLLPRDLEQLRADRDRPDMRVREVVTDADLARIWALRMAAVNDGPAAATDERALTDIRPRFTDSSTDGLSFLAGMARGDARFCEYPFTEMFLDTYRTYVCCQATTEYLYGHRYVGTSPRLAEVWNGDFLQGARRAMYRQGFDEVCMPHCEYYASGGTYETIQRVLAGERRVRSQARDEDANAGLFTV